MLLKLQSPFLPASYDLFQNTYLWGCCKLLHAPSDVCQRMLSLLSMTLVHSQCHHSSQVRHRNIVESCQAPLVVSHGDSSLDSIHELNLSTHVQVLSWYSCPLCLIFVSQGHLQTVLHQAIHGSQWPSAQLAITHSLCSHTTALCLLGSRSLVAMALQLAWSMALLGNQQLQCNWGACGYSKSTYYSCNLYSCLRNKYSIMIAIAAITIATLRDIHD